MNIRAAALLFCVCCFAGCGGEGDSPFGGTDPSGDAGDGGTQPPRVVYPRQMETLDRGVAPFLLDDGQGVHISWRFLGDDPAEIGFDIYRSRGDAAPLKLTETPIVQTTDFVDLDGREGDRYAVRGVNGGESLPASPPVGVAVDRFWRIPLAGNYGAARVAVGDLDGDGMYDYIIKQPRYSTDPGVFEPPDDTYKIEAYLSDGTFLWRRDLGWNIVMGEWWSPLLVYDLDGDGRAEVVTKTAPMDVDLRNNDGRVLAGEEWLSILDGLTGVERARDNWIPRGDPSDWGDSYGNRVNRNKLAVAYLDGRRPSLVVFRGIYRLMKAEAWNFRDGNLSRLWRWENAFGGGFRDVQVGDIDGDGFDELINGAMAIDEDGTDIWNTGEGGGDRSILADIDPERPGLEIWYCQDGMYTHPYHLRDAETGALVWGDPWWALWDDPLYRPDNGRSVVGDVDPRHPGLESWTTASGSLFSAKGEVVGAKPSSNAYAVYWDGDPLREVVEAGVIGKYDPASGLTHPVDFGVEEPWAETVIADLFGDFREEIVYTVPGELRIYAGALPATLRIRTLMHDSMYRTGIAMSASGWAPNGQTSFFLGDGMATPPSPLIVPTPL